MDRETLVAAVDYMTEVATAHYPHDHPTGRHYHVIVEAARAYLETLPKKKSYSVTGIDALDPREFTTLETALDVASRAIAQGRTSVTITTVEI